MDYWIHLQAASNRLKQKILREAMITKLIGPAPDIHTFNTTTKHQYLVVWQPLVRKPWLINFN